MAITARLKKILTIIAGSHGPVPIAKISDVLEVSTRTIQRELKYADEPLSEFGLTLDKRSGKGVEIFGTSEAKKTLLVFLGEQPDGDAFDIGRRRQRLTLALLQQTEPEKLFTYAQQLDVSESTVAQDIDTLVPWFDAHGLHLHKKPGFGVAVSGTEEALREALRAFVNEAAAELDYSTSLAGESEPSIGEILSSPEGQCMSRLFGDGFMREIIKAQREGFGERFGFMTVEAAAGFAVHLAILIMRLRQHAGIHLNAKVRESLTEAPEYALAHGVGNALERRFALKVPADERTALVLHIQALKLKRITDSLQNGSDEALSSLVMALIQSYDKELALPLSMDEDFCSALLTHLKPTLVRLTNGLNISNPVLEQIRRMYPTYFAKCRTAAAALERRIGAPVPDDEIGYLALHFGTAEEKLRNKRNSARPVCIGVICDSGIGMSRLMIYHLEQHFGNRAVFKAWASNDVDKDVRQHTDFFISPTAIGIPNMIRVSPIISDKEFDIIDARMKQFAYTPAVQTPLYTPKPVEKPWILQHFQITAQPADTTYDQIMKTAARLLTTTDSLAVYEAFKKREALYTQVYKELGIVLLHASVDQTNQPQLMIIRPEQAAQFSTAPIDGIHAVLVMLLPNNALRKDAQEVFGSISSKLIEEPAFLKAIQSADEQTVFGLLADM